MPEPSVAQAVDEEASIRPKSVGQNDRTGEVALGKRYASADGAIEVLCIKPGAVDLRYDGAPMELMQPKVLPSAD